MKKTTIAAAKKAAKKAVKTTAVKTTATKTAPVKVAIKKAAAPKPAAKKVAAKAAAPKAPKKAAASKGTSSSKTTIIANADIGFGNTLFLRGDAPGLSWAEGVPMDCQDGNSWSIAIADVSEAFEFKVLINDSFWSSGYNHSATPGSTTTIDPQF